jgi:hypothetical protein
LSVGKCALVGGVKPAGDDSHRTADSCDMGLPAVGRRRADTGEAAPAAEIDMYLASAQPNALQILQIGPVGGAVLEVSRYVFASRESDQPSGLLRSIARQLPDGGVSAVPPQKTIWPIDVGLTWEPSLRMKWFLRWTFKQSWARGP